MFRESSETESQGRVHTSAITIAVLPEAEEVDVEINPADIEMQTLVLVGLVDKTNKVETKVQLTHKPSGIVVVCQQARSQLANRELAMEMLRAKLYDIKLQEVVGDIAKHNVKQWFLQVTVLQKLKLTIIPQGRVTDHRINKSIYNLDVYMNGDIQEMMDAVIMAENAEKMKGQEKFKFLKNIEKAPNFWELFWFYLTICIGFFNNNSVL